MKLEIARIAKVIAALCMATFLLPHPEAEGSAGWPRKRVAPASTPKPEPVAEAEAAPPAPEPKSRNAQVIVLGYHRFVDKVRRPDTELTPADFEAQMQQLKDGGVTVIPMADFLAWKRGEKEIPPASAVITLDDGWRSQYTVAWPILKKFNYPFTLFIYTDYVKGGAKAGGESLSWQELEELRDGGVNIESHTVSHADLRGKKNNRNTPEYDAWLKNELQGSKQMLEQRLGIKIRALALPYGFYNAKVQEAAKEAGYEAIFTVNGQKTTYSTPSLAIGRLIVESKKDKLFADSIRFNEKSGGGAPPVAELAPSAVAMEPAQGATLTDHRPIIKANLRPFGKFDPASLSMRLSGIGPVEAKYDPATQTLSYQPPANLAPSNYTVIISAMSGGAKQESRWSFTVGPEAKVEEGAKEETPPAPTATP